MAVGTQAVQPEDAAGGLLAGDYFDRIGIGHEMAPDIIKAAQCNAIEAKKGVPGP